MDMTFANNLNRYMKRYHKTNRDIATYLGVSETIVGQWRKGAKFPRMDKVNKLCTLFNCSRNDLMLSVDEYSSSNIERVTGFIKVFDGIPCGDPRLIDDNVVDYQPTFLPNPSEYFAVIVHGDSMIGVGIEDGDKVTFHAQNYAENGNIVACRINDEECTLKRFRQKGDIVVLMPENPSYEPIIVPVSDFESQVAQILGVAKEVSKKL